MIKKSGFAKSPRVFRKKKCKNAECRTEFVPVRELQAACGVPCAIAITNANKEKARKSLARQERAEIREKRVKLKSRAQYLKETQAVFNEWVRARDAALPCVSCGRHHEGQYHAGHYRTVGANPELRFEPLNVHKQCAPCNNHKSGDIVNYRIELVTRIGADKVDWLEGPHEPQRYTIEELKTIKADYRAKTRDLKGAA
ncbi:recombination protein NinG [Pseudomonas brassicacearum]|uniref:recombination protein NinG n=1 Tax=Pseudomonas brassicacearum TaxID=930166 RepID=UPI00223BF1DD|nr:recombination protein NinG [Pseudomonas brassicacearum]